MTKVPEVLYEHASCIVQIFKIFLLHASIIFKQRLKKKKKRTQKKDKNTRINFIRCYSQVDHKN